MTVSTADLVTYAAQLLVIVAAAAAASAALPLPPRGRVAYWRGVVVFCLLLPVVPAMPALAGRAPVGEIVARFQAAASPAAGRPSLVATIANNLALLLAAGALVRGLWLAAGCAALFRLRRSGTAAVLTEDEEALRLRIAPAAEWRWLDVGQPVTFGLRRPTILLPPSLHTMTSAARRAVLCHELLHVARRDWAWLLIEEAVRSLFWFHPAGRWAIQQVQVAREQVVDERVVDITAVRRDYMEALMTFSDSPPSFRVALSFIGRSQLRARIANLARRSRLSARRAGWRAALLIVVTGVAGVATVSALPRSRAAAPQGGTIYTAKDPGVQLPTVTYKVSPNYPPDAQARKVQGIVELECVVTTAGVTEGVQVVKAVDDDLDRAAVEALLQWRFNPGTKDGEPVPVQVHITINFTLR
jgi:TonB family protein